MRSGVHWPLPIISGKASGRGPGSILMPASDNSTCAVTDLHHRSMVALPSGATARIGMRLPGRIGAASSRSPRSNGNCPAAPTNASDRKATKTPHNRNSCPENRRIKRIAFSGLVAATPVGMQAPGDIVMLHLGITCLPAGLVGLAKTPGGVHGSEDHRSL